MTAGQTSDSTDELLHAAELETLERRIMDLALERTAAHNGAIFLHDRKSDGLAIHFHVVEDVVVDLPGVVLQRRTDDRPNGIALWVLDHNRPYLCGDTAHDSNYASYFLAVGSMAAVPIQYQRRAIGVITVSSPEPGAFDEAHLAALEELAASAAKFLRRAQLAQARGAGHGRPFLIKGLSEEWLGVERRVERVAPTSAPVLIQGESGTGKELLANAIHFNSARASQPLVAVNCAALPETLLESTLFGHVRGAFTGASFTKVGEFRKAHQGTLFLDEVGELPLSLQAKLLRAVEQGEILPLGSNAAPTQVDVRLICATHRDLPQMVRRSEFRDDLYFRIGVVTLELPPLRSYKSNLEVLANVFLMQSAREHGREVVRFSAEALSLLQNYSFPGNVRELKNIVEHAVIMAADEDVQVVDLPRTVRFNETAAPVKHAPRGGLKELRESWLAPLERRYLTALLAECGGDVSEAARRAGINRVTMYRLLKKRGISLRREFE